MTTEPKSTINEIWLDLCMSDSGRVELFDTDEDRKAAARLRAMGLVTGRRTVSLTAKGRAAREKVTVL
jgi:hypothetical protein